MKTASFTIVSWLLASFFACLPGGDVAATTLYVKPTASGTGDGSSWANAAGNLQAMIDASAPFDQIWVAAGTYKPTAMHGGSTERDKTFFIDKDIEIYGGFLGTETMLSQRDWVANVTILSGDIGIANDNSDNCYHVVWIDHRSGSMRLDGFTIKKGKANGSGIAGLGGGIYNDGSSSGQSSNPTMVNCAFTDNWAFGGGGIYNNASNGVSSPSLIKCSFSANSAFDNGGGILNNGSFGSSSPSLMNCAFSGNTAIHGGGINNIGVSGLSSPILVNCSFSGNVAYSQGGGIFNTGVNGVCSPSMVNCSFSGNSAGSGGGIFNFNFNGTTNPNLTNCILWGNSTEIVNIFTNSTVQYSIVQGGYVGAGNLDIDPLFVNQPDYTQAPSTTGDLRLQACSPALDAGNDAANQTIEDLDGNPRKFDAIPGGSLIDLGAFEFQGTASYIVLQSMTTTPEFCEMGNGSITIAATATNGQIGYSINGGASFQLTGIFEHLTAGSYPIVLMVYGVEGCNVFFGTATVGNTGATQTWWKDLDGDDYSDGISQISCTPPTPEWYLASHLTATTGDCDDTDPLEHPGVIWHKDQDNDGYSNGATLVQCARPFYYKAASELVQTSGDCNDTNANVHPGKPEICNSLDDDCDGQVDEGVAGGLTYVGNVTFTTQAQVNAWSNCYAIIQGNVTIQNAGITNLVNLSNIVKITGNLTIKLTALTNLNGLNNLYKVGGTLKINTNNAGSKLQSLDGLESLDTVGVNLQVFNNFSLADCCAIHDLVNEASPHYIGGNITIVNNPNGCSSVANLNTACNGSFGRGSSSDNLAVPGGETPIFEEAFNLTIFPNPAADWLRISVKGEFSEGILKVFDATGRAVYAQKLPVADAQLRLDVGEWRAGIYLVQVSLDGRILNEKVILE